MYPFAGAHQPLFTHGAWAYLPVAAGTLITIWVYKTISRWGHSAQWNTSLALALASGALVGHTIFGFMAARLKLVDRIGLAIMLIIMAWLLHRLYQKQIKTASVQP